jgi:hypothetical protein
MIATKTHSSEPTQFELLAKTVGATHRPNQTTARTLRNAATLSNKITG